MERQRPPRDPYLDRSTDVPVTSLDPRVQCSQLRELIIRGVAHMRFGTCDLRELQKGFFRFQLTTHDALTNQLPKGLKLPPTS